MPRTRDVGGTKTQKGRTGVARRRKGTGLSVSVEVNTSDAAELLATKWLDSKTLDELAKNEGVVFKKGKFSVLEDEQLLAALDKYREEKTLSEDQLLDVIFPKKGERDAAFWTAIARAVPMRPVTAVYHHVRRIYHPLGMQGKWTPTEDETLVDSVLELGQQWEKVSARVGRTATDCRDRWRNKVAHQDKQTLGRWTKEEESRLTEIMKEMTAGKGKGSDHDVFWTVVAERMGHSRSRQQCRNKWWVDTLSKLVKTEGSEAPRWSAQDAFILVAKVDSLDVQDDSEIDWKILPDSHWNLWSPHVLQRRWRVMKEGVRGYEHMSHAAIMDILRVKKAYVPDDEGFRPKKISVSTPKQYKSKEIVTDSDDADGEVED
ncbi:hypothetical protein K488DRAFT_47937 [Vararia minispora EC-137]|uniref:Uncharacterized protein n=1 Tax=Vararia minispora EC-137 TaxID=1314806 RepID=A0ACB8QNA5_9AGAM|nr:hypothetical protein K488DRAFT_47937 [Vararia minispora EC-137]